MEDQEKVHYVNNKEFLKHIKEHAKNVRRCKRNKLPPPQVTDFIAICISNIANKLANRPNFINYTFREDMISDGIENCLQYINNFNPKKSNNPFAYFTQIIYFAFVRKIQKEKRQLYTKFKMAENTMLHEVPEMEHGGTSKYGSDHSDAFMREFMENFEKGRENKKTKAKKAKKTKKL